MKDAVIFGGINSLDFEDVRQNAIRIPEVQLRIKQAQKTWDQVQDQNFDLHNFIASEDQSFLSNIKLKSLAAAIVQVGLYDRYANKFSRPEFILGSCNGDSALRVVAGVLDFERMIADSAALNVVRPSAPLQVAEETVLSGVRLTEYACYHYDLEEKKYLPMDFKGHDIQKIVQTLIDDQEIRKFINIGPGQVSMGKSPSDLGLLDIQMLDSIDLDPMLSWFWPSLRSVQAL